jgi:hypothetical protein
LLASFCGKPFVALEGDLVFEQLALRADRNVLAGRHGEGPGGKSRDAGDENQPRVAAGPGDAEDQACIRDQPVVDPEDRGPQIAAAAKIAMAEFDVAAGGRCRVTGFGAERRAVDRHPAHLHRGQHRFHSPRPEQFHHSCHQQRARVGRIRGRRRMAACRQLRAPDRPLGFGLAGETREQLGAHRAPLGFRAGAVQKRGALLFGPA